MTIKSRYFTSQCSAHLQIQGNGDQPYKALLSSEKFKAVICLEWGFERTFNTELKPLSYMFCISSAIQIADQSGWASLLSPL